MILKYLLQCWHQVRVESIKLNNILQSLATNQHTYWPTNGLTFRCTDYICHCVCGLVHWSVGSSVGRRCRLVGPSVRWSIGPCRSVGTSIRWLVGRSVGPHSVFLTVFYSFDGHLCPCPHTRLILWCIRPCYLFFVYMDLLTQWPSDLVT